MATATRKGDRVNNLCFFVIKERVLFIIITYRFLTSLGTKEGDDFVIYDVAERKVYFFHHSKEEYRLKLARGKRRMPVTIRQTDKFFRVDIDGTVSEDLNDGFTRKGD